ncbi:MAG: sulfotransferase [Desulfobacterales bacterium]|nr:sulfotransferase [Desulfobacterales bacterium]
MKQTNFDNLTPVFILGIARSGTTLLQSLLDGHPQLLVDVADSHFVSWYKRYYRWIDRLKTWSDSFEKRLDFAEAIMISYIFNQKSRYYQDFLSHVSIDGLKKQFRSLTMASDQRPQDFIQSYFHALGLASGHLTKETRCWVDKSLSYEYLFYRYLQWWPNAKFIYVIRDPRDVYTSYKKRDIKNKRRTTSVEKFSLTWSNSFCTMQDCQSMVATKNRYILRYEDLIYNPQSIMQSIAKFLDINFQPCLLSPSKGFGRVPWGGNPESGKKQKGFIYKDAARKWEHYLQPSELGRIESLLGDQMETLGYTLSRKRQPFISATLNVVARRFFFRVLNFGL